VPSDLEFRVTRAFNAPRRLVFEAFSKPEHLRRWWLPKSLTMIVCEMDFRPGGSWRLVLQGPDGQEHPFKGVYKEIVVPEKIVQTFIFDVDGIRDHPAVETMTLEERDGKTLLTRTTLHKTKEARDGHFGSGMEAGATETFNYLAELLETMK